MIFILKLLSPLGLIMNIIGAYLIFKFGIPEVISKSGSVGLSIGTDEKLKLKAKKYDKLGKFGLCLLIAGFILQLIPSLFNLCENEKN